MAKTKASKPITADTIISKYMDHVLEHEHFPLSIYKFCKQASIKEADFYTHFGSFEGIQKKIWVAFFNQTHTLLAKDKAFETYPNKEKMLALFFTLFEVFTANRSYILFVAGDKQSIKHLKQLSSIRSSIKDFATQLIEETNEKKTSRFTKNPVSLFSEGAWVQFLFLLKFWIDDQSPAFEKTDVAIEKSVTVIFDVFETTPLDSILDFGKFLVQDKFAFTKAK